MHAASFCIEFGSLSALAKAIAAASLWSYQSCVWDGIWFELCLNTLRSLLESWLFYCGAHIMKTTIDNMSSCIVLRVAFIFMQLPLVSMWSRGWV